MLCLTFPLDSGTTRVSSLRPLTAAGDTEALPGETAPVSYTGGTDGGHPKQRDGVGYTGAAARGISVSSTMAASIQSVRVDGVMSAWVSEVGGLTDGWVA